MTPSDIETLKLKGMLGTKPYDHDAECEEALHAELQSLRAHKARLDTELAEMRKINQRQMAFLQDAAAFIRVANSGKGAWNSNILLATLIHDINGVAYDEECFVPRVTGYAQREAREEFQEIA